LVEAAPIQGERAARGRDLEALMATVFLVMGVVLALCFLHPFVTYPLSLLLLPAKKPSAGVPAAQPETFALCFCAYNEEHVIEEKMRNLLALCQGRQDVEILAYVDAATDRTASLLQPYADRIRLHVSPTRHGKSHGMNLLVAMTSASIVVFTDANVMLDSAALDHLPAAFADPAIGCVCGHLIYSNPDASVTAASGSLYWRLEEAIKRLEARTGSVMGADGSIFAVRRGLHRAVPDDIIDDMYLSFSILCEGYRIGRAEQVKAYEASATSQSDEIRRKRRIACQAFNVHRLLWPQIRRLDPLDLYKYVSHKLLRWFSIYTLLGAALCLAMAGLLAGQGGVVLAVAVMAAAALLAGAKWHVRPFDQVWDILCAFAATGAGVWLSLKGQRFQTWNPAESVRTQP
jgi:cellulose synthase/poly-beta-1,6-N-acetylglucosamine synthase-like glycosyltransferase